ncbi:hypothetical protein Sango_2310900 [Sesamum angolense]|uniref:RNase H type-1 domain-containing protein n=1 Tax=Sesamum angolense TaxID=2727404 RepID=A0AAE1WAD7_9LAMI|nr:hypothetical protein Sango_2310900 [Sesamum angolense]
MKNGSTHSRSESILSKLPLPTKSTLGEHVYLYLAVGQQEISSMLIKEEGHTKPIYYVTKARMTIGAYVLVKIVNEATLIEEDEGIRMALDAGARNLITSSDSQLVINQLKGMYEVEEERMKEYLQAIGELTGLLKIFQLHQIPRAENAKADYLARLASSLIK